MSSGNGKDDSNSNILDLNQAEAAPEKTESADEFTTLKNEVEEQKKKNMYLRADFDNFRKQTYKERDELYKFASEPAVKLFLTILDDLERAANVQVTADTVESYKNGVMLIVNQFKKAMEKLGVEEMTVEGKFDPNSQEALTSEPRDDVEPNTVTKVFRKAYKMHGKLIRPAQVVVSAAKN